MECYFFTTDIGDCVHAGKSGNLYKRMEAHWGGGGKGADGDLIQKVQDGGCANRHSAQDWMASHCALRWLEVPDPETRDALEWRLKSVLQPKKTQVLEPELTSVRRHCRCGASVSKPCAPRKRTARQASTSASFEANSAWNALQIEAG